MNHLSMEWNSIDSISLMASGVIGITDDEVPVVLIGNMQALCHAVLVHLEASRFYHSGPGINA